MTQLPAVFIVGSPRSGTTLLHHMLVSSGLYADYRAETHLYDSMMPKFGSFARRKNLERFVRFWLATEYFRRTRLDPGVIEASLLADCRSGGHFLNIVLGGMAEAQGVPGWAECTPAHVHFIDRILAELPNARIIHIVRDGRDVALSLDRLGWVHPLPWDRGNGVEAAAWLWEWRVNAGRRAGARHPSRYLEVRFEDLVRKPRDLLAEVSEFLGVWLDYDAIRTAQVGSVAHPNTAFSGGGTSFDPVERWRSRMSREVLERVEASVGDTLSALGYSLEFPQARASRIIPRKAIFHLYRSAKLLIKSRSPLGRLLATAERPPVPEETVDQKREGGS